MNDLPPPFGENLPGGYRLLRRLGRGAYGEVWRAEAPGGVEVAVKLIPRALRPEEAQRELDGLQLIKRLRHPFLLSLQSFYAFDDRLIIVLELAEQSLRQRLHECRRRGEGGIPVTELLRCTKEAAEALDYLHANGVQHRDIKPDNLLLLGRHVKVADYGLARTLENTSLQLSTTVGTPAYMAPEVWEGKVKEQSDQYSLAVTYVELRLGRTPFDAENMLQMAHLHLHTEPNLGGLGVAEQEVMRRALAKDTARRFATCQDFARTLTRAVASDSSRAQAGVVLDASLFGAEGSTLFEALPPPLPPPLPSEEAQRPLAPRAPSTTHQPLPATHAGVPGRPTDPQPAAQMTGYPAGLVLPAGRETIGASSPRETARPEDELVEVSRQTQRPRTTTSKDWREPKPPRRRSRLPLVLVGFLVVAGGGVLLWKALEWSNSGPTPVVVPKEDPLKGAANSDKGKKDPTPQLRLSPGGAVTLWEGASGSLEVGVQRQHCKGPVQLKVDGLPPGVRARAVTVPADKDKARIELEADEGAAAGARDITVRAQLGETQAAQAVRLTVKAAPPLRLPALAPVVAQAGQTRVVGVRVERRGSYKGPIELRLEGLPRGVSSWPNRIPEGSSTGALALNIGQAPAAKSKVRLLAVARRPGDTSPEGERVEGELVLTIRPTQPAAARLDEDNAAIQRDPTDPVAHQNRGHTYRELGELDKALADLNEAVRLAPEQAVARVSRALVYLARREHDQALTDCNRALELSPGYVPAYLNRGLAQFGKRAYDRAIQDFGEVLQRDRNNVSALANRANAHRMKKDYDRALKDCAEAIRLDSTQAQAFNVRGLVHVAQGKLDEAIADYSQAIKHEPKYLFAHYNRGLAYAARKKYDQAIDDFTEALTINPKFATAYKERGHAYQRKQEYDKAIDDFTQAIDLNPEEAAPRHHRGLAYASKKEYGKAIDDYTQAIRRDSKYALAYLGRANAHYHTGFYDKAIDDFNQAANLDEQHEKAANRPRAYYQRGLAHLDKGDRNGAVSDFTTAIRLRPDYALAYYKRGNVHLDRRDYDLALKDYDKAIEYDPKHAFAYHGRGNIYFDRRDYDQAVKDYSQAIELSPDNPVHHNNRGNAYRAKKDLKRALADYNKAIDLKPEYAFPYHGRGNVYFARKDYNRAIDDFDMSIRLDAQNPYCYNDRGAAHSHKGNHYLAIADYTRAIKLKSDYALAYANRFLAYMAVNDRISARPDREAAVRLDKSFDEKLQKLD